MKIFFNNSSIFLSFSMLVVLAITSSCGQKQSTGQYFGENFDATNAQTIEKLLVDENLSVETEVKVKGVIEEVCQKKGCWMTLKTPDGSSVRVTFKDYGFFVPKDAMGKEVVISGIASSKELDQATLEHYAEDAGKDVADMQNQEVSIVSDGVLIM